jgi:hypothetical protein
MTNRNPLNFKSQNKKPSRWFWGPNHQTVAIGFEAQTEKTLHHLGFEAQPRNPPLVLRTNWKKPSPPILRSNRRKLSQWFWDQTTHKQLTLILMLNQETCAPRLHMNGADRTRCHPTSRSSDHRVSDLCDHPRSSAPGLLLLPRFLSLLTMPHLPPAHNETSKRDSPNKQR